MGLLFGAYYAIQKYRRLRRARLSPLPVPKQRTVTRLSTGPDRVSEADRLVRDYELTVIQAQTLRLSMNATPQGERREHLRRLADDAAEREGIFRAAVFAELVKCGSLAGR